MRVCTTVLKVRPAVLYAPKNGTKNLKASSTPPVYLTSLCGGASKSCPQKIHAPGYSSPTATCALQSTTKAKRLNEKYAPKDHSLADNALQKCLPVYNERFHMRYQAKSCPKARLTRLPMTPGWRAEARAPQCPLCGPLGPPQSPGRLPQFSALCCTAQSGREHSLEGVSPGKQL